MEYSRSIGKRNRTESGGVTRRGSPGNSVGLVALPVRRGIDGDARDRGEEDRENNCTEK